MPTRPHLVAIVLASAIASSACASAHAPLPADPSAYVDSATRLARATHGLAIGEVTAESALVWSRTDADATMHARLVDAEHARELTRHVDASHDHAAVIRFDRLSPDTRYEVEVWFEADVEEQPGTRLVTHGSFRTAPSDDDASAVRFAFGGDVAGQNICRDRFDGMPIFRELAEEDLDFFVALGDMIYADGSCGSRGRYGNAQIPGPDGDAVDVEDYWAKWRYARADAGELALHATTPVYAIWDDHEIEDDFDPNTDARSRHPNLPAARRAFFDWNPVRGTPDEPYRLHRSIRWGRHLELFVLDTRQYRDPDSAIDAHGEGKSMLGDEQRAWLEHGLATSDATWKVVVSSVTVAVPTGHLGRRDGWASHGTERGFERELRRVFESARNAGTTGIVFVSADVHFAAVFRHRPFAESPWFEVGELVAGPLHARPFPLLDFDRSFGTERLFFYGPDPDREIDSYEEAKAWMNYARVVVDDEGALVFDYRNGYGQLVHHGRWRTPSTREETVVVR